MVNPPAIKRPIPWTSTGKTAGTLNPGPAFGINIPSFVIRINTPRNSRRPSARKIFAWYQMLYNLRYRNLLNLISSKLEKLKLRVVSKLENLCKDRKQIPLCEQFNQRKIKKRSSGRPYQCFNLGSDNLRDILTRWIRRSEFYTGSRCFDGLFHRLLYFDRWRCLLFLQWVIKEV